MKFDNLRIKDLRAVVSYKPNMKKWRADNRKDHFVGIQLDGSARHTFKNRSFVLYGNCVYFFNAKEDYDVEVYEPTEAFSVHFTTYEELETESFCIPIDNPEEFVALLQKAKRIYETRFDDELTLISTVYQLCAAISRAEKKTYFQKEARIFAAKSYIDENFKTSDCLLRAAEKSGLSQRRFGELFKRQFDVTPNRYVVSKKMKEAKMLLEMKNLTVTEVAELCGFSDVYYFSKVFKQLCGIPPSEWK